MLKKVVEHPCFIIFSFMLIIGNTLVLAMDSYPQSPSRGEFLKEANTTFSLMFAAEMLLKIFAYGPGGYVRDTFNMFDGVLVLLSLIDIITDTFMGGGTGTSAMTAFRTLRLLRIFKLAKQWDSLIILMKVLIPTDLLFTLSRRSLIH